MGAHILFLAAGDVRELLPWPLCIAAVERAFWAHGSGAAAPFGALGIHAEGGGFHVKAGILRAGARGYFAAKVNGNFPGNPARGLPTIQGVVVLCDADSGVPLAIMDSAEITRRRTAAATAVAAKHLARPAADTVAIIGCGAQALAQIEAVAATRKVTGVRAFDSDRGRASALVAQLESTGFAAGSVESIAELRGAGIVITCTPSRVPVLALGDVAPGTFVAAVGADHPEKREIAGDLMASATVVVDVMDQASAFGDLHHALAEGSLTREQVHAELGAIVAGRAAGRRTPEEIIVFDSTGMALQDVAAAAAVYEAV